MRNNEVKTSKLDGFWNKSRANECVTNESEAELMSYLSNSVSHFDVVLLQFEIAAWVVTHAHHV